jgi:hypothetical protein
MSNKILDAVRQLDTKNDNHWTADGLPRIETVKMLAGDSSLTRESLEKSAPGFNRTNASEYKAEGEQDAGTQGGQQPDIVVTGGKDVQGDATPQPEPLPTAPPADGLPTEREPTAVEGATPLEGTQNVEQASEPQPGASGQMPPEIAQGVTMQGENKLNSEADDIRDAKASTAPSANAPEGLGGPVPDASLAGVAAGSGASETQLGTLEGGSDADGNPDALEALQDELEEAEAYSQKLREAADKVNGELANSTANESRIRAAIAEATPRGSTMQSVQNYFAMQDAVNEKQAAMRKELQDKGIDLAKIQEMIGAAPIDKAVAAANKKEA